MPLEKIVPRYERSLQNAVKARKLADELWLYDNTVRNRLPRLVARYRAGEAEWVCTNPSNWAGRAFGVDFERWRRKTPRERDR